MTSIHENLEILGVPRTVAKVVEILADGKPHLLHEIEVAADLRQSEVSIAVGSISGYVDISIELSRKKGRPQKIVQMSADNYKKYVDEWADYRKRGYENVMKAVNELKKSVMP